jgi:phospholipid/cholesterol/gamma-HCH transport system permease protein
MNFATRALLELQETTLMAARAARGIFKRPRYIPETIAQMDAIGVGSLTIIILTGFFTGGVLTVQTFPTLKTYGAQSQTGYLVAISLVRELGPVLCALMVRWWYRSKSTQCVRWEPIPSGNLWHLG